MTQNTDSAREAARRPAGSGAGGQFGTQPLAESPDVDLMRTFPDQDALDFARETLGPNATYDEVVNLASLRADRDERERPDPGWPHSPLTPRDVETLVENKGCFADGYDSDAINRVLGSFESAKFVCVWGYYDDYGYGGDSDFAGRVEAGSQASGPHGVGRAVPKYSPWQRMHPGAWEYLSDPDSDIDPETIPSLLSVDPFDVQDVDELPGDGFCNASLLDETDEGEECAADGCDDDLSDGEGYDGYCGHHADLIENHKTGEHDPKQGGAPDDDCPECV